jgi:hypothetical protein
MNLLLKNRKILLLTAFFRHAIVASMKTTDSSILRLARLTRWLAMAALVIGAALWLWESRALRGGFSALPDGALWVTGTAGLAVTGFGLVRIIQLMRLVEAGRLFDRQASRLLASFAAAILVRELIDVVATPLVSAAMRLHGGKNTVTLTLDSSQGHVLFIAVVFLLIAKIMAAGHQLADDHARII